MTTATIVTGDSPGNFAITSAVINEAAASPITDITTNPGPYGSIVNVAQPTKADTVAGLACSKQDFTLTLNGPAGVWVVGRVGIYGSSDGVNWQWLSSASAQGYGPVTATHRVNSPVNYWTSVPEFCSPGATVNVSMTF